MLRSRSNLVAAMMVLAIALSPAVAVAQNEGKIDVTGKWQLTVTSDAGTGTPTLTLKQQGDSLTGHYSSQALGEADVKGTIKENKITFTFRVDVQGTTLTVVYAGTVDTKDSMRGTVDLGGMGSGTFTAKR